MSMTERNVFKMKTYLFITFTAILILSGCTPAEKEILDFDLKKYPGAAVIGNGGVRVMYSDDERITGTTRPVSGGILHYYFENDTTSYIGGSTVTYKDDTGMLASSQDTFGLEPFFSPFQKISFENFKSRHRIFATGEGIIVQQVTIQTESDLNTFVQWSLHTPVESGPLRMNATDIMEDGIYHRYNNNMILAFAATGDHSQYNFDRTEGITTITTPLRLKANSDTTLTFFITAGTSDTDVITKMFAADRNDLFEEAKRHWNDWLATNDIPLFPHIRYEKSYKSNLYAVYASGVNDDSPLPETGQYNTQQIESAPGTMIDNVQEYIQTGDRRRAEQLIREVTENTNSYGLIPETDTTLLSGPLSPVKCSDYLDALHAVFKDKEV